MVVFEDGLPRRDHYRKFAIDDARDDTDAIYQVVARRLRRLIDEGANGAETKPVDSPPKKSGFAYPPGLLVVDGGAPQVSAARRAMEESGSGYPHLRVGKTTRGSVVTQAGLSGHFAAVLRGVFVLQRVRDEAHRVALSYQKTTRRRSLSTQLSDIPGVGDKTVKQLCDTLVRLRHSSKPTATT
jgi:excinuclease ABC subunit C